MSGAGPSTPGGTSGYVDPSADTPVHASAAPPLSSFRISRQWLRLVHKDVEATGGEELAFLAGDCINFLHQKLGILPGVDTLRWLASEVIPALSKDLGDLPVDRDNVGLGLATPRAWTLIAARMPRGLAPRDAPPGMAMVTLEERALAHVAARDLEGLDELLRQSNLPAPVLPSPFRSDMTVKPGHEVDSTLNGLGYTRTGSWEAENRRRQATYSAEFSKRFFRTHGRVREGTSGHRSPLTSFKMGSFSAEEEAGDATDARTIAEQGTKDLSWRLLLSVMSPDHRQAINKSLHSWFVASDGGIVRHPSAWRAYLADPLGGRSWPEGFVPASLLLGLHLEHTGSARFKIGQAQESRRLRVYHAAGFGLKANDGATIPPVDPTVDPAVSWINPAEDVSRMAELTTNIAARLKAGKVGGTADRLKEEAASAKKKTGGTGGGSASGGPGAQPL